MRRVRMTNKQLTLSPILKWVGGKRQLLDIIIPLVPNKFSTYVEPFVGGAAVLLELKPKKAIINDSNEELINVYNVVKNYPEELFEYLIEHDSKNSEDYFYEVRAWDRDGDYDKLSSIKKASRIIYLNKTCFNGLFRVNQAGQFNAPYGKYKNPNIINKPAIMAMSYYFNNNNIKIINGDYKNALKGLRKGAFIYFDPPYMPISDSSSFTGYTESGFSLDDQVELRNKCIELDRRGVKFLLSNSDHPKIRELYKDFNIATVKARRSINSKGNKRGEINEVLVRNYE